MVRKLVFILASFLALFLAAFFLTTAIVKAQEQPKQVPTDDEVNAVAKKLYCPVCPNTPLDVCETKSCQDWREQIRDELANGWTEQQIMDYFVQQYGERVLGEPQRKGFTSMVWVLPVIGVVLGGIIVWQVLRAWRLKQAELEPMAAPAAVLVPEIPPDIQALVEKELEGND